MAAARLQGVAAQAGAVTAEEVTEAVVPVAAQTEAATEAAAVAMAAAARVGDPPVAAAAGAEQVARAC